MQPKFCQNCGAKLKPDSKFCPNCGAKVEMIDDPKSDDHHESPVASDDKATKEAQKTDTKPKETNKVDAKGQKVAIKNISQKKSFKIIAAIVVILAIVLAVALHNPKLSNVVQGSIYQYKYTDKGMEDNPENNTYLAFSKDGRGVFLENKRELKECESKPFDQFYKEQYAKHGNCITYTVNNKSKLVKVQNSFHPSGKATLTVSKYSKNSMDGKLSDSFPQDKPAPMHYKKIGTVNE